MEILGGLLITACLWFAQSKPVTKKEAPKKPDITVEVIFNNDRRKGMDTR